MEAPDHATFPQEDADTVVLYLSKRGVSFERFSDVMPYMVAVSYADKLWNDGFEVIRLITPEEAKERQDAMRHGSASGEK